MGRLEFRAHRRGVCRRCARLARLCHHCLTNLTASSMLRQDAFRSQFRPIAVGGCELHKLLVVAFPLAASPAGSAAAAAPASP
jgi:hypothetical protein